MWKEEKNTLYRKFEFKDFSEAFVEVCVSLVFVKASLPLSFSDCTKL